MGSKEHLTWTRADGTITLERDEHGVVAIAIGSERITFSNKDAVVLAYWLDSAVNRYRLSDGVEESTT